MVLGAYQQGKVLVANRIETHQLVVTDVNGNRAVLGADPSGGFTLSIQGGGEKAASVAIGLREGASVLKLASASGAVSGMEQKSDGAGRAYLGAGTGQPEISMVSTADQTGIRLTSPSGAESGMELRANGEGYAEVSAGKEEPGITLAVGAKFCGIELRDAGARGGSHGRALMYAHKGGPAGFTARNGTSSAQCVLYSGEEDTGALLIQDAKGRDRVRLGLGGNDAAGLHLLPPEEGPPRIRLAVDGAGKPAARISDASGVAIWSVPSEGK